MKSISKIIQTALDSKGSVSVDTGRTNEIYKFLEKNRETVGSLKMDNGRTMIFNLDNPDLVAIPELV